MSRRRHLERVLAVDVTEPLGVERVAGTVGLEVLVVEGHARELGEVRLLAVGAVLRLGPLARGTDGEEVHGGEHHHDELAAELPHGLVAALVTVDPELLATPAPEDPETDLPLREVRGVGGLTRVEEGEGGRLAVLELLVAVARRLRAAQHRARGGAGQHRCGGVGLRGGRRGAFAAIVDTEGTKLSPTTLRIRGAPESASAGQ
eukprot:CAMPEP_0174849954 /NCGR_PEP_ID=MMETSP1114-20130205/18422_1 /TAXON_ID=312471 /ORGANISM="Neobodo designis, Strain CCAP 1951/1" /LENGTH=203 /DNA_ID=CAMNT_0016084375 /DNA_START=55 /DNA_END=665 /DNA_ORIENTATION=-